MIQVVKVSRKMKRLIYKQHFFNQVCILGSVSSSVNEKKGLSLLYINKPTCTRQDGFPKATPLESPVEPCAVGQTILQFVCFLNTHFKSWLPLPLAVKNSLIPPPNLSPFRPLIQREKQTLNQNHNFKGKHASTHKLHRGSFLFCFGGRLLV